MQTSQHQEFWSYVSSVGKNFNFW